RFDLLRPGKWKIHVSIAELPAQHQLETQQTEISLTQGATDNATFKVVPKPRTFKLIDSGAITH
ncbi:MAG: hypothetical protein JWO95_3701, partial [Verrucomicrobiales bacterium]|nr:hypothetical protein [Verrucomicrobiales bacterium]